MNRVTVTLPHVTYLQLKKLAKRDGVSVSQYVTYAIAKQVEQVETGYKTETPPPAEHTDGSAPAATPLSDVMSPSERVSETVSVEHRNTAD